MADQVVECPRVSHPAKTTTFERGWLDDQHQLDGIGSNKLERASIFEPDERTVVSQLGHVDVDHIGDT